MRESKAVGVLGFDSGLQRGPRYEEREALPSPRRFGFVKGPVGSSAGGLTLVKGLFHFCLSALPERGGNVPGARSRTMIQREGARTPKLG